MIRTILTCTALAVTGPARAEECVSVEIAKQSTEASKGTWTNLTDAQFNFMRGVWARDPSTPDRMAYGDRGAVAKRGDKITVFFIDDDLACDPMEIGETGLKKLMDVGSGEITHAPKIGDPL